MLRLDVDRAPAGRLSLDPGRSFEINVGARQLHSSRCSGVWWRRPEAPPAPPGADAVAWVAAQAQWRAFMAGLETVPGLTWISRPSALARAEDKSVQIAHAVRRGFRVPATVWTNDRDEALRFLGLHDGRAVLKSITGLWWEDGGADHFLFARMIDENDLPDAASFGQIPACLQQVIDDKVDLRVTVVGRQVFAAAYSPTAGTVAPLDWRTAPEGSWGPVELPDGVAAACVRLVEDLGLAFAGIDLLQDGAGDYWFLEANPNGEWGWLQKIGLPIAEALVAELCA